MDRCIRVPEIVQIICDHLAVSPRSCRSMALASRMFLEPALDNLWHSIDSFEPLIACLPDGSVEEVEMFEGEYQDFHERFLARVLEPEDLDRYLNFYAHRIRHIHFQFGSERTKNILSTEDLHLFQLVTGNKLGALSPRLRHFSWPSIADLQTTEGKTFAGRLFPLMALFIGESLRSLTVPSYVFRVGSPFVLSALQVLTRYCGHLEKLQLLTGGGRKSTKTRRDDYITSLSWNFLTWAIVDGISSKALFHLLSLPRLQHLDATLSDQDLQSEGLNSLDRNRFPPLLSLRLRMRGLSSTTPLIQLLPRTNTIQSIDFQSVLPHHSSASNNLLSAIAHHCNSASLERLSVSDGGHPQLRDGSDTLDVEFENPVDLGCLSSLRSLKHLKLNFQGGVKVDPASLRDFALPWRNLEHLDLCPSTSQASRVPLITHQHVVDLVIKLPSLQFLGMRFDTTQLAGDEPNPEKPYLSLRKLCVGESPICSPSRVSKFLTANFPKLQELVCYCARKPPSQLAIVDKRWKAVMEVVNSS
ncbi:hypothetical protein NMY22_g14817 [Coprinellus aureogranulatus]|nr:hypothetical protein NMY22_g14817 [Coprinellus aureogranulatus]